MGRSVIAELIGIVGQPTIVRLMPGLRPARTRVLAFLFLVRRRRLGRSPRRFIRSLKLDHQLNQLVLAQALQISAIHAHMDSEIALPGKGVGKYTFYNEKRPHQAMDNQMPMAVWRAGMEKIEALARTVDMPLRLDNANALPTYPQRQQHQAEAA